MLPALAKKTIDRVTAGLESGEAAGLAEIVELIQQLSSNALQTSVQELASLIGKDLVVTAKVIASANTLGYNPSGIEVSTITQAIHVIGFNKIRQLAVSLLLIENAERTLNPREKREIAALALCSGLMAESVMEAHGSHAPEHAFICASLRNYGQLLMTTFMLDEYRQARGLSSEGVTEDEAFNRIFGLTPLELGHHLLASAHLPEPILKSLRKLPLDAIRQATQHPEMELLILADLSVKFCELALRPDVSAADFERHAALMSTRSGRLFGLDVDGLFAALQNAGKQLNEFATTFGLTTISQQVNPRLQARVAREDPVPTLPVFAKPLVAPADAITPPPSPAAGAVAGTARAPASPPAEAKPAKSPVVPAPPSPALSSSSSAPLPAPAPASPPTDAAPAPLVASEAAFQEAFDQGIEQLAGLLDQQPVNMAKIFKVVLKSAIQGFGASQGVIFVRERSGNGFDATLGQGALFDAIRDRTLVREADRNVCGISLQRMEDVFIYDSAEAKIIPHLPAWMKDAGRPPAFVLLPMHENRRPFALLLAGWPEKKTKGFTVAQIRQVRSMLKLVGTARRLAG